MKFFLVISIIALWWAPMNSPGNIGIPSATMPSVYLEPEAEKYTPSSVISNYSTMRKMDHFGDRHRKHLVSKMRKSHGGKLSKFIRGYSR